MAFGPGWWHQPGLMPLKWGISPGWFHEPGLVLWLYKPTLVKFSIQFNRSPRPLLRRRCQAAPRPHRRRALREPTPSSLPASLSPPPSSPSPRASPSPPPCPRPSPRAARPEAAVPVTACRPEPAVLVAGLQPSPPPQSEPPSRVPLLRPSALAPPLLHGRRRPRCIQE